jgi:hypothetical protein
VDGRHGTEVWAQLAAEVTIVLYYGRQQAPVAQARDHQQALLVEETLIALQASFGYITKFTVDNKTPSGLSYQKHVKGHIVVFPNKVEDIVATVLPHPLLVTIENIHVSWSGSSKPGAADVRHFLQVRKSRIRAALS